MAVDCSLLETYWLYKHLPCLAWALSAPSHLISNFPNQANSKIPSIPDLLEASACSLITQVATASVP